MEEESWSKAEKKDKCFEVRWNNHLDDLEIK